MELGAGNGTLLADVLDVISRCGGDMNKALNSVAIVERSEYLREKQCARLKGNNKRKVNDQLVAAEFFHKEYARVVEWYNTVDEIPEQQPILVIGQEFLDTFPVHQLMRNKEGEWREKLITVPNSARDQYTPYYFETLLSPVGTPAVKVYIHHTLLINSI